MGTPQGTTLIHAIELSHRHMAAMPFRRGEVIVRVTDFGQFVNHNEQWTIEFTDRSLPEEYSYARVNQRGYASLSLNGTMEELMSLGVPAVENAWRPL